MTSGHSTVRGRLRAAESRGATVLHRFADALCIVGTHYAACRLYPQEWALMNTAASAIAILTFQVMAEAHGLYQSWSGVPLRRELVTALASWFTSLPVLLFLAFITKSSEMYSRFISSLWFAAAPTCFAIWRIGTRLVLERVHKSAENARNVAIAGATKIALELARTVHEEPHTGMRLVGFYDDRNPDRRQEVPDEYGGFKGGLDDLVADARAGKIDIVYISLPLRAEARINDLVRRLGDTTVSAYVIADFFVFDLLHAQWTSVGDIPAVSILDTPFHGLGGWVKRLEDLVVGSLILALIALPMLVVAVGVKLTSPGPVLFVQKRYGLNGKEIRVLKFRSMRVMEDGAHVKQATKNDPRITPLGRFIRRTSIDELPQFLQVLTGEMSIVGPRPHAVAHNEMYRSKIQGYMLRHKVKPGITGWAQVNGWRGETDTDEKMKKRVDYDLDYIRNWSLLLDLRIIWLTVFGRKVRDNAY